jgi:hypothetical protein
LGSAEELRERRRNPRSWVRFPVEIKLNTKGTFPALSSLGEWQKNEIGRNKFFGLESNSNDQKSPLARQYQSFHLANTLGANSTATIYNASSVKSHNTTSSLSILKQNKKYFLQPPL